MIFALKLCKMSIKKIHYLSGLILSIFVGFHLFNHAWSVFGATQHIQMMNALRIVYRNIFIETLLLSAVFAQIVSGLKLFMARRKNAKSRFEQLQIYSGLYLAFFFIIHVSAVLAGRVLLKLDTNFYFGVAGLNTFPLSLFFIPYYGFAILAFFGHISSIHNKKMTQHILGFSPNQQSFIILLIGFVYVFIIFYGLTNHFTGVKIPKLYEVLIGK